jgi:hypothetical protein
LPNGTVIDLDDNLSLATGGQAIYYSGTYPGGIYTVSSADLGSYGADADKIRAKADVTATSDRPGFPQQVSATNNYDVIYVISPEIMVVKEANPTALCEGDTTPIVYTYTVTNEGDVALDTIVLVDDTSPCQSPAYMSGDDGSDGILGLTETWIYQCKAPAPTSDVTNTATVSGYDVLFDTYVSDTDTATVEVNPPPSVSVNPPSTTICEAQLPVQLCAVVEPLTGTPPFTYAWTKTGSATIIGTESCISVSEAGEYCVTVTDDAGCSDNACGTLTVIEAPSCSIDSGPRSICQDDIGIAVGYCSDAVADGYDWDIISGPATIDGVDNTQCVSIIPNGLGTIVLELNIWNDNPTDGVCGDSCQIEILVEECGGTFCTFTQGAWGNAGGKACGGQTTSELIQAALTANGGSIMVGQAGHSITFNSVQCILDSLPAGGKPAILPAGDWTCATLGSSGLNKKNKPELNNVLIGQAVALTLNLLVSEGCVEESGILADWVLPEEFCTVPYGDEEACAEYSSIPTSMVGKTVAEMLAAVNAALAGTGSLSDAYGAATAINEGFDECRTIVPCIRPEICGNGCDDDGDGLTDCCDPDCNCEICDDGIDNDCDGLIDIADDDCTITPP